MVDSRLIVEWRGDLAFLNFIFKLYKLGCGACQATVMSGCGKASVQLEYGIVYRDVLVLPCTYRAGAEIANCRVVVRGAVAQPFDDAFGLHMANDSA